MYSFYHTKNWSLYLSIQIQLILLLLLWNFRYLILFFLVTPKLCYQLRGRGWGAEPQAELGWGWTFVYKTIYDTYHHWWINIPYIFLFFNLYGHTTYFSYVKLDGFACIDKNETIIPYFSGSSFKGHHWPLYHALIINWNK